MTAMTDDTAREPGDAPNLPAYVFAEQTHLRLPSRPDWIEPAVDYLRTRAVLCGACHEPRAGKLMVALHEAISNAIVHGNLELSSELKERGDDSFARELAARAADPVLSAREVDVAIDYDGDRCRWLITDEGPGFDVPRVFRRLESDDPDVLLASGRGILMMRSLLDEVRYERGGRRCILTLRRGPGEERRRHPRAQAQRPLRIAPIRADGTVDWDAAYEAVSRNLSESGVALLQARLATTDRVLIGLVTDRGPLYLPAEIRHWRPLGSDTVELGCRFQVGPSEDPAALAAVQAAVTALLQGLSEHLPHDERRAHPRVVYTERVEVRRAGQPPQVGFARDLSRGGMSFIATAPLPVAPVVLALPQRGGPALHVRAQVVRCTRVSDGYYDVGARFVALEPAE